MKKSLLLLIIFSLFSFSIFTDSTGRYRKYPVNALPFDFYIHSSTPSEWINPIQNGAKAWNLIKACYFQFRYAGFTEENDFAFDGVNLVYFDFNNDNFEPGTNVIAFSGTFTEGVGTSNYRAVESDLIWNAASFPPAVNDDSIDPVAQDLQSIISHEFGHHMGLGHTGNAGQPPGVGLLIEEATMYGLSSGGDTTGRSLHMDDIMGAVSIYPRWLTAIHLSNRSGQTLDGYKIIFNSTISAVYDAPVSVGGVLQKAGYIERDSFSVISGDIAHNMVSYSDSFGIKIKKFAYQDFDTVVAFDPAVQTPVIKNLDIRLKDGLKNNVNLSFTNAAGDTIDAVFRLFSSSNELNEPFYEDTISQSSLISFSLPSAEYELQVEPAFPYAYKSFKGISINADTSISITLEESSLLIIDDDDNGNEADNHRENYYLDHIINKLEDTPAYLNLRGGLSKLNYNSLVYFRNIVWLTGNNQQPAFINSISLLDSLRANGHNLLLTGNFLASSIALDNDLQEMFGIDTAGKSAIQLLQGISGDIIGQDDYHGVSIAHPEMMKITGSDILPVLNYLGTEGLGAVRHQSQYKFVLFSFALEDTAATYSAGKYLERSLDWFNSATQFAYQKQKLPAGNQLFQNYPNPFNPVTTISYQLSKESRVHISVFDINGRQVKTLLNIKQSPGFYTVKFNAGNIASGIYYYALKTNNFSSVKKMLFIK